MTDLPVPVTAGPIPAPFLGIATFARQPHQPEPGGADVAVIGVPYDSATSYRSGTRFGPRAIREQSTLLWGYNNALKTDPFRTLRIVDAGDVPVVPVDIRATHAAIERKLAGWIADGSRTVCLGGDHSLVLPALRAHARRHGPLAVVHFDAHPDTWDQEFAGQPYSHGTPFRRAIEEGLIVPGGYVQLGIRGPTEGPQDYAEARRLGAEMLTLDALLDLGIEGTLERVHEVAAGHPVYVSLDIDVVDPAFAPGTGTPEVGGLTSRQILQLVRGLRGLRSVGFDLVEVSPPYDPSQITAILGANLVFEMLSVWSRERGTDPAAPAGHLPGLAEP